MKRIGLLCPLFSLPNEFGIGDFSFTSFQFLDFLHLIHYSYWQILPLNPIDSYNSPYQPISSFAIDDIYISLEDLKERGLINSYLPYQTGSNMKRVNYKKVRKYKNLYLKEAFNNFKLRSDYKDILNKFIDKESWVFSYGSYVVLKRKNKGKKWNEWLKQTLEEKEINNEVHFEIFKQYLLYSEWNKIHKYAKERGIEIIGDLPFYVGYDSSDVYYNQESFLLKEDKTPKLVAGVPPDYFSSTGQLWGNPIYDWDYLKENDYKLLFDRILHASKIYDVVRLDHFRAFDTYYTIDANAIDAKIGAWLITPSYDFFDSLFAKKEDLKLIAEDLGEMREEVYKLRDHYNLPGMQVIQFTFKEEELYHVFLSNVFKRENSIVYLSTHDNETTMQWFKNLNRDEQMQVINYLDTNFGHHHIMTNLFKYAASQPGNTVILSIWDVLRLGRSGRLNAPGSTSKHNWSYRIKNYAILYHNAKKLKGIADKSNRH